MTLDLTDLLTHLDQDSTAPGWHVRQITGGANGLVYHARSDRAELAVKFCLDDERDRAGREYAALTVLQDAGSDLAPRPLLLERSRYRQPVVVQSWLAGEVSAVPPETGEGWMNLLEHYAALARVRPEHTRTSLKPTVLNASSFEAAKALVRGQLRQLPDSAYPEGLREVVLPLLAKTVPAWPPPPVALCRGDGNLTNFVRLSDGWRSLDWENGGWGDPAFEMADLITHPAYARVPQDRWPWVVARYAELTQDASAPERIRAYVLVLAVWWVVRTARYLYEVPRGLDPRLVALPEGFLAEAEGKYRKYVGLAQLCLAGATPV